MLTGIAGLCLLLTLLLGPQLWTRHVFKRHDAPLAELPGTGGELARHLLTRLQLTDFSVQALETAGDHYDPENKTVCLSPGVHEGKSLTAVVVAAHEVGHALQHFTGFKPLYLRWNLAKYIAFVEKAASVLLVSFPFVALLSKSPLAGGLMLVLGLAILLLPVVFHLVTLPVEWDASFNRALPLLLEGEYLPKAAEPVIRRILTAAALTYVSASLFSLLNFYRWIAFLRR